MNFPTPEKGLDSHLLQNLFHLFELDVYSVWRICFTLSCLSKKKNSSLKLPPCAKMGDLLQKNWKIFYEKNEKCDMCSLIDFSLSFPSFLRWRREKKLVIFDYKSLLGFYGLHIKNFRLGLLKYLGFLSSR